jgi:hypothetical protein
MEITYLLLSVIIATLGFITWYLLSSSLELPKRYQVMFDANTSFANRVYRRRLGGFALYAVIPWLIIFWWNGLGRTVTLQELGISFSMNQLGWMIVGGGLILQLILFRFMTRSDDHLAKFPEIRLRFWTPAILVKSFLTWILYLVGLEFLYRGLLFQSLTQVLEITQGAINPGVALNIWVPVVICAGIYSMIHYFKRDGVSLFAIIWGVLACFIVHWTGSLLPVILLHVTNAIVVELYSIRNHQEMYFVKK